MEEALSKEMSIKTLIAQNEDARQKRAHLQVQLLKLQNPQARFMNEEEKQQMLNYLRRKRQLFLNSSFTAEHKKRLGELVTLNLAARAPDPAFFEQKLVEHVIRSAFNKQKLKLTTRSVAAAITETNEKFISKTLRVYLCCGKVLGKTKK